MTFTVSRARRGLDWLLKHHPHLELVEADWQRPGEHAFSGGPWLLVTLGQLSESNDDTFALYPFAIFKRTGAVYGIHYDAVDDEPLHTPDA